MTPIERRLAACFLSLALAGLAGGAPSASAADLEAQATRLVALPYADFIDVKRATPAAHFDWSSDGCSSTPAEWARTFDGPCQQHDFGYRNFGRGPVLRRTEAVRAWIDRRLLSEMRRVCAVTLGARRHASRRIACRAQARLMWAAVRLFNDWSG